MALAQMSLPIPRTLRNEELRCRAAEHGYGCFISKRGGAFLQEMLDTQSTLRVAARWGNPVPSNAGSVWSRNCICKQKPAPSPFPGSHTSLSSWRRTSLQALARPSNIEAKPWLQSSMLCKLKTGPITSRVSTVPYVKWGEQEMLQTWRRSLTVRLV